MIDQRYGEGARSNDCPYSWLNEWLCEYVDGTMDPSVRAVFEEYMKANPELAEHVEQLCRTRSLLCECERRRGASEEVRSRLHDQVAMREQETSSSRWWLGERNRLSTAAAAGSAMLATLTVGMVIGATFFATELSPARQVADRSAAPPAHAASSTEASPTAPPPTRFLFTRRTAPSPFARVPSLQLVGQRQMAAHFSRAPDLSAVDSVMKGR